MKVVVELKNNFIRHYGDGDAIRYRPETGGIIRLENCFFMSSFPKLYRQPLLWFALKILDRHVEKTTRR